MKITYCQCEKEFDEPVTVREALRQLMQGEDQTVFGCQCGGTVMELSEMITDSCEIRPITYQDEEGRRMYERSLRFVLLLALRRVMPGKHLRIEHSVGRGIYMRLLDGDLDEETVAKIQHEMNWIVAEDLPFRKSRWSRKAAMDYFLNADQPDTLRLLAYRPFDFFHVYTCGGMSAYFYGAMLPSTGYVKVFDLLYKAPGMVLMRPDQEDPSTAAAFVDWPRQFQTFAESNHWCDILQCMNAADLNDMIVTGKYRQFIRVNEALHDKSIADIADGIARKDSQIVFIAGPSSSGKTTFANRLAIHLRVLGLHPVVVSLDDFYRDRVTLPLEADGKPDLESIDALDLPYLRECIKQLLAGDAAQMPRFDFKTQKRKEALYPLQLKNGQILILEGIHGLNPLLTEGISRDKISSVYISELTCLNIDNTNRIRTTDARLLRRIVRDYQFRGTSPVETLQMWPKVRAGEEKWIFPFQETADFIFNSALHYELPVLKRFGFELLESVSPEREEFLSAQRILKILRYLIAAPESAVKEVPPLSLLREFIGGGTLEL